MGEVLLNVKLLLFALAFVALLTVIFFLLISLLFSCLYLNNMESSALLPFRILPKAMLYEKLMFSTDDFIHSREAIQLLQNQLSEAFRKQKGVCQRDSTVVQ